MLLYLIFYGDIGGDGVFFLVGVFLGEVGREGFWLVGFLNIFIWFVFVDFIIIMGFVLDLSIGVKGFWGVFVLLLDGVVIM